MSLGSEIIASFVKPQSAIHISLRYSARSGFVSHENDSDVVRSVKAVARLIAIGIAAYFFAYIGIFYNATLAIPKKVLSLTCRMIDRPIFGCDADEYANQFKLHLVFGVIDFLGNTFFYVIAPSYMLFPRPTLYLASTLIEVIESIGLTSRRPSMQSRGTQTSPDDFLIKPPSRSVFSF